MDFLKILASRRSIRRYSDQPITQEQLDTILRAAFSAPSAGNQQPWHFLVITKRELLNQIPKVHPSAKMCTEAAAAIIVCGDDKLDKHKGFWIQDCSAATMNILLAAHALGLGAVWCGVYPREDRINGLRQLFKLPNLITPLSLIPMGYPAEKKEFEDRYKQERIHHNVWE